MEMCIYIFIFVMTPYLTKKEMFTYLSHLHEDQKIASQCFPPPRFIRKYRCVNTGVVEVMVLFDVWWVKVPYAGC